MAKFIPERQCYDRQKMLRDRFKHSDTMILYDVSLIDGNGGEIQEDSCVVIRDSRIAGVCTKSEVDGKTQEEIISNALKRFGLEAVGQPHFFCGTGLYVMPGLIDAHVHYGGVYESSDKYWMLEDDFEQAIRSVEQCHQSLRHGFTTVRDISRNGIYLRNLINDGHMIGPRIVPCGRGLTRTGGHADGFFNFSPEDVAQHHPWGIVADGVEEVRKAVRSLLKQGSEYIKLWASGGGINEWERETDTHFTEEEIRVMVEEAAMYGVPVAAHCENKDSIMKCIKAGVRSIEHGEEFDEEVAEFLHKTFPECGKGRKEYPFMLVPTIGLYIDWYETFEPPKARDLSKYTEEFIGHREIHRIHDSFALARELGVRIAVGADSFCSELTPYGMYTLNEMYQLKEAGMTESEVITAGTKNSAMVLGIDDVTGTIEAGKDADILILTENPLSDIKALDKDNIYAVIRRGDVIDFNDMSPKDEAAIARKKGKLD